jgi:hypothetical protein
VPWRNILVLYPATASMFMRYNYCFYASQAGWFGFRAKSTAAAPEFAFTDVFAQPNKQPVPYRLLTSQHVKQIKLDGRTFLEASSAGEDR